jgi:hypothetical protein
VLPYLSYPTAPRRTLASARAHPAPCLRTLTQPPVGLGFVRQVQAGNKEEVVRRCVDGEQHGAYPRCPTCTKQTVKPNKAGDGFVCPGTFEEGSMIKCMFKAETVERLTWNDSEVAVAHEEEEVKPDAAGDAAMAGACWLTANVKALACARRLTLFFPGVDVSQLRGPGSEGGGDQAGGAGGRARARHPQGRDQGAPGELAG